MITHDCFGAIIFATKIALKRTYPQETPQEIQSRQQSTSITFKSFIALAHQREPRRSRLGITLRGNNTRWFQIPILEHYGRSKYFFSCCAYNSSRIRLTLSRGPLQQSSARVEITVDIEILKERLLPAHRGSCRCRLLYLILCCTPIGIEKRR